MKAFLATPLLALGCLSALAGVALAGEWSGSLAAEGRGYLHDPLFPQQRERSGSLAAHPEYYHQWDGGNLFVFSPFVRLDSADRERTHVDLREMFFLWVADRFEMGIGVRKVFWGVTESQHLVDIINQTDLVEYPDGEDKLGQPMVNLSIPSDWGIVDLFLMPYFRERTFPGARGRLRTEPPVDTDHPLFESGADRYHLDVAVRYSQTWGDWDVGLSHFRGTGREPTLLPGLDKAGRPALIPLYEQIDQTGLTLQWVVEAWLWKVEAIHRTGQGEDFFAWTGGFEYTFTGIVGTRMDLGVIGEWLHDTRRNDATTPFEQDLMVGFRLAVNDVSSTELLFGIIQDLGDSARLFSLEASRRIAAQWTIDLESLIFSRQDPDDLLFSLRNDDFSQLTVAYHF